MPAHSGQGLGRFELGRARAIFEPAQAVDHQDDRDHEQDNRPLAAVMIDIGGGLVLSPLLTVNPYARAEHQNRDQHLEHAEDGHIATFNSPRTMMATRNSSIAVEPIIISRPKRRACSTLTPSRGSV